MKYYVWSVLLYRAAIWMLRKEKERRFEIEKKEKGSRTKKALEIEEEKKGISWKARVTNEEVFTSVGARKRVQIITKGRMINSVRHRIR